ncbi:MAG: acetyl-CoA acetyltransferase [Gammaproteobacteria bacterium]|nr:acetyl-CoA acetyltransferase [Gammaproteobacteria bacterium]
MSSKSTSTPVLVGAGQYMERPQHLDDALSPSDMMELTAQRAAEDAGLTKAALAQLDRIIVVNSVGRGIPNPTAALARRLGAESCDQLLTITGGNTPQMLVNQTAEAIARGEVSMVLLAGAEALDTVLKARQAGIRLDWDEGEFADPVLVSREKAAASGVEQAHAMVAPINTYPLFENALRHHYGRSFEVHQAALGELCAPFTDVAAANPFAWFPIRRSGEEIATASADNRYVGYPYTKFMNAIIRVNQSAAVLLTSEAKAQALGIDSSRYVYLHGCADANDIWYVSERLNYHSSPAIRAIGKQALKTAGRTIDEIGYFDLYSCFPSAVETARDMLGIPEGDPRPLSVTGGLPYFGGPGNNYVMHSVAAMMARLRASPGEFGIVTGNGWYLTKHSLGIYSTTRPARDFIRDNPQILQERIDRVEHPLSTPTPSGSATVETYTVLFDRQGEPERGLIIGRLDNGARFVAFTSNEATLLNNLTSESPIGRRGQVHRAGSTNLFEFA